MGVGISFLGRVVITGTSEPAVELDGRRTELAFARLVLDAGEVVSREALADVIWDGRPPESWRSALRNVIAGLRGALPDAVGVDAIGTGYRLTLPEHAKVDLLELESAAEDARDALSVGDHETAQSTAAHALRAYAGTFLDGAEGEWALLMRARADEQRAELHLVAGEAALGRSDPAAAVRAAQPLVAAVPLREDGHRLLIRAHQAAGNNGAALMAFDACRRVLMAELGVAPSEATRALLPDLLGEPETQRPAVAGPLVRMDEHLPLVGRAATLRTLRELIDEIHVAGPRVVLIGGEPGAGKTRLAARAAVLAQAAGLAVLYGRADDHVGLPFRSLLEALDAVEVAASPRSGDDGVDQQHAVQDLADALLSASARSGALVVLDDLQWESRATTAVLETVAASDGQAPLLVLALHRPGWEPLASERALVLELDPLTREDIVELAGVLGTTAEPGLIETVWRQSGGNPLFATELMQSWQGPDSQPARIAERVRARVASLTPATAAVLRTAAVAGLEFDPRIVAATTAVDAPEATRGLEVARQAGLIVEAVARDGWLAFRHALVRQSLLEEIGPAERMRIHRRLGTLLEVGSGDGTDATLAYHFAEAAPLGDWRRALRYGLPVVRSAAELGIDEDVVPMARRTLAALAAADDPDRAARLELQTLLGGALRALGDPAGLAMLEAVFAEARSEGDGARMADAALQCTAGGASGEEVILDDRLVLLYEEALAGLTPDDRRRRARLLSRLASAHGWMRDGAMGWRLGDEALVLARELDDPATLSLVLTGRRRMLTGTPRVPEQANVDDELLELATALDDVGGHARTWMFRFETALQQGRGDELEAMLDTAAHHVSGLRGGSYHHTLAYHRAGLALLRGEVDEAERLVERAATVGREHGVVGFVVEVIRLAQLEGVRREQGRLEEHLGVTVAYVEGSGMPEWHAHIAYLDAELGRLEDVPARLDTAFDGLRERGERGAVSLAVRMRLALPVAAVGDLERAATVYDELLPHRALGPYFTLFGGPMEYHLGLLAAALGRPEDARSHFAAGADFCARLGAPLWLERCRAELSADAHGSADRQQPREPPDGGVRHADASV